MSKVNNHILRQEMFCERLKGVQKVGRQANIHRKANTHAAKAGTIDFAPSTN